MAGTNVLQFGAMHVRTITRAGLEILGESLGSFGIPAFFIYEHLLLRRPWHYALGGFLFMQAFVWGLLFTLFAGEVDEPDFTYDGMAKHSAMMGLLGFAATTCCLTYGADTMSAPRSSSNGAFHRTSGPKHLGPVGETESMISLIRRLGP